MAGSRKNNTPPKEHKFSAFGAAGKIEKRKYQTYKTMVETSGGKNVPLSFDQWKKSGMPAQ